MIRNVIFDWSGTLVDDLPAVWEATNYVFRMAELPEITLERFRAEFRLPFQSFYDRFTPHIPMEKLEAWFHGRFQEIQGQVQALPHARQFLKFCRANNLRTFILSTMREDHFRSQANRTGLIDWLERLYLGVWDKRTRIKDLLKDNHLSPKETLFVGDMEHDIETAHHGGVYACAVLTGYNNSDQLQRSRPHLMVNHLGQLQAFLENRQFQLPPDSTPTPSGSGKTQPL